MNSVFNWKASLALVLTSVYFVGTFIVLLGIPDHKEEAYQTVAMCNKRFNW